MSAASPAANTASSSSASPAQEKIELTERDLNPESPHDLIKLRKYLRDLKKPVLTKFCDALEKAQTDLANGTIDAKKHMEQCNAIRDAVLFLQDGLSLDEKIQETEKSRKEIEKTIGELREWWGDDAETEIDECRKRMPADPEKGLKAAREILKFNELSPKDHELSCLQTIIILRDIRVQLKNQSRIVEDRDFRTAQARNDANRRRGCFFPDNAQILGTRDRDTAQRIRDLIATIPPEQQAHVSSFIASMPDSTLPHATMPAGNAANMGRSRTNIIREIAERRGIPFVSVPIEEALRQTAPPVDSPESGNLVIIGAMGPLASALMSSNDLEIVNASDLIADEATIHESDSDDPHISDVD